MEEKSKTLVQYIRKGSKKRFDKKTNKVIIISKGKPVGIMVACKIMNSIGLGFSRYHLGKIEQYSKLKGELILVPQEPNPFNEEFGINVAGLRAVSNYDKITTPNFIMKGHPKYVKRQFIRFAERAKKYFKGLGLPPWFEKYSNKQLKGNKKWKKQ